MADADPYLIILKNGPIFAVEDYVSYQLETLSQKLRGEMWVTGNFETSVQIGRFTLNVVKDTFEKRYSFFLRYFRRVLQRASQIRTQISGPVVVIAYDPFRNGLLGFLVKRRGGWPLIIEINGVFGDAENFADSHGLVGRVLKPWALRTLGRAIVARADGVRLLFNEQLRNFAKPSSKAVVRQYFDAVPLDRFPPGEDQPYVLHLGFPYYRKGVDLLLAAYERIHAEFPTWRLVLIGYGLEQNIPNPPAYIEVRKPLHNKEVAPWVSNCAFLVLASRSEGMGRVLIEAGAAAKPRLVSRVGGTYTVVEHESDGLLFEKNNVEQLTACLRKLMGDESLRRRLGEQARRRAIVDFSAERYSGYVSEMVGAVLAKRGPT